MQKAIVLTYAPTSEEEKQLLINTDIFKVACNWHSEELKPNVRITLDKDETIEKSLAVGNQPIISIGYPYKHERVIERFDLPKRFSSLISCVDYLYTEGYTDILLVANNLKTNQKDISNSFQKINIDGINSLKDMAYIYKYSKEAVFDVPTMSIKEFIETDFEHSDLEALETRKSRLLKRLCFSDSYLYRVHTKGKDNYSIETGTLLSSILTQEEKERIASGEKIIEAGTLLVERLNS